MAESLKTKKALAQSLKDLLLENDFEKISISDICDGCGMSRKSFYYHFHDKYELVIWIFKTEFLDRLRARTDSGVFETLSRLARYLYTNKSFYKPVMMVSGQNSFAEHFSEVCRDAFGKRIREQLDSLIITDLNVDIFADFFVYTVQKWLTTSDSRDDVAFVRDLSNAIVFGKEVTSAILEPKPKNAKTTKNTSNM